MLSYWYILFKLYYLPVVHSQGEAKGQLYIDDGHSFNYKKGESLLRQFSYSDNKLTSLPGDSSGTFTTKAWLEKVLVVGATRSPTSVTMMSGNVYTHLEP